MTGSSPLDGRVAPAATLGPRRRLRLGWYSELTSVERRTYWACFAGFGLDSMDTTIYALVIPSLIAVLGLTKPEAGYLATAALIGTAFGGWGGGILADRIGRIRVLQLTILWVAVFTFAAAFTNSFAQLFAVRFLQGLGYGGEAAVGGVLISEVVRPALRGRVAASIQSSYAVGYAISVGVLPLVSFLPEQIGWRVFFAIGIIPAFLIFFIRRLVPESGIYAEAKAARAAGAAAAPFWEIFTRAHLARTVTALVMATGIFGGAYVIITWLPTYLRTALNLSVTTSAGYLAFNITGSLVGPFCYGLLADRVGRRPAFMAFLGMQACNVAVYLFAPIGPAVTIALSFVLGALQGGLASGMLPTFAELFPTRIRANGQGFGLGGGRGLGSVLPSTVGVLTATMPLGTAMGACALCAYAIASCAAIALPETKGAELRAASPETAGAAHG
ncbi:MAG TPA: MFS transporter [Xanthobacteraceae bacterium]|nr:MFS transporter [Xanthobacteraceae bacterium]